MELETESQLALELLKSKFINYREFPYRAGQAEAVKFAIESDKKVVVLQLPTGFGKSLAAMACLAAAQGGVYMVHSKVLQNQIGSDFPEAKSLFGRGNYRCVLNFKRSCAHCIHTKNDPCELKNVCIYEARKKEVLQSTYKILNYDYFLSESNFIGRFGNQDLIVIDEADNLENTLINFISISFTKNLLERMGVGGLASGLKMTSNNKQELLDSWASFIVTIRDRATMLITECESVLESLGNNPELEESRINVIKEKTTMTHIFEKAVIFLNNINSGWILDKMENGTILFRPLWVTPELADKFLWNHGKKFILMSASFPPPKVLSKCLGMDSSDVDYYSAPSPFPVEIRPIYIKAAANLTAKTMDVEIPFLVKAIKKILNARSSVKGIIHTVSYGLARRIIDDVNDSRLIIHGKFDKQQVLDEFISTTEPLVLLSPSIERGLSLSGDLCRFAIIAKAPFLSLGDKMVSQRLYTNKNIGNEWYKSVMLLSVLQMCGRGVRSIDDFCETFILDEQIKKAITERPMFLPRWFLDGIIFGKPPDM